MNCPKCTSNDWDHANVGLPNAIQCTNCGHVYQMELTMGLRTTFNIEYKGIWLDVDVKRGISRLDGKHWVHTQEVRHADETITAILDPLAMSQIDHIVEKELNK